MARVQGLLVYAQSLDNSGAVEMLSYQAVSGAFEDVSEQPRDKALLALMDRLLSSDAMWRIGQSPLHLYWCWNGDCIVQAQPVERDAVGRVSPVMLVFNMWTAQRKDILRVAETIHHVMHRSFDATARADFVTLQNLLDSPALIIFLRMLLTR